MTDPGSLRRRILREACARLSLEIALVRFLPTSTLHKSGRVLRIQRKTAFGTRDSVPHFPSRLQSRNVAGHPGHATGAFQCIQARAEKEWPECPRNRNDAGIFQRGPTELEKPKCTCNESWCRRCHSRLALHLRRGGRTPIVTDATTQPARRRLHAVVGPPLAYGADGDFDQ